MKKTVCVLLAGILLAAALAGCSGGGLSGKYVSEDDNESYFQFSGSDKVIVCEYGMTMSGTYALDGDTIRMEVTVSLLGVTETVPYELTLSADKNEITDGYTTYIKK